MAGDETKNTNLILKKNNKIKKNKNDVDFKQRKLHLRDFKILSWRFLVFLIYFEMEFKSADM